MTPGARVEAAIGLIEAIGRGGAAADDIVAEYFRRHRFVGAKDRAAISRHIYGVLRRRGELDWWLERCGAMPQARTRLLAELAFFEDWNEAAIRRACDGDRFRPRALDDARGEARRRAGRHEIPSPGHAARGARQFSGLAEAPFG